MTIPGAVDDDMEDEEKGGIVVVKEGLGAKTQTIAFKVVSSESGALSVGMALPEVVKGHGFKMNEDGHGLYTIGPAGYTYRHNRPDEEGDKSFLFQAGEVIQIDADSKAKKITFTKRGTTQKHIISLTDDDVDLTKLQFAVDLYSRDSIQIVD